MKDRRLLGLGWLSALVFSLCLFLFESCKETHTIGNTILAMICLFVCGWSFAVLIDLLSNKE